MYTTDNQWIATSKDDIILWYPEKPDSKHTQNNQNILNKALSSVAVLYCNEPNQWYQPLIQNVTYKKPDTQDKVHQYIYVGCTLRNNQPISSEAAYLEQKQLLLDQLNFIELHDTDPTFKYFTIVSKMYNIPSLIYLSLCTKSSFKESYHYRTLVKESTTIDTYAHILHPFQAKKLIKFTLRELEHWNRYYGSYYDPSLPTLDIPHMYSSLAKKLEEDVRPYVSVVGVRRLNKNNYLSRKLNNIYVQRIHRWSLIYPTFEFIPFKVSTEDGVGYNLIKVIEHTI